jgi:hypothetical protein
MGDGKREIKEYSRMLREFVIKQNGGSSEIGRMLGEERQTIHIWVKRGFPIVRCGEFAVFLFGDIKQRYLFHFEKVYEYEKWGKNINLLSTWRAVINRAPIDDESKKILLTYKGK